MQSGHPAITKGCQVDVTQLVLAILSIGRWFLSGSFHQVRLPKLRGRNGGSYSSGWVKSSQETSGNVLPDFTPLSLTVRFFVFTDRTSWSRGFLEPLGL